MSATGGSDLALRLRSALLAGHARADLLLHDDKAHAPPSLRSAAVLIAITDRPKPGVILLQRPDSMRTHPGQIAFPGGKLDPGESNIQAALREANEELSISSSEFTLVGETDQFTTLSGYSIAPVVGVVPPDLPLVPNPEEVSAWFEAPLHHVLNPANHHRKTVALRGFQRNIIEIEWQGHRIWGITAAILANLSYRLSGPELTFD